MRIYLIIAFTTILSVLYTISAHSSDNTPILSITTIYDVHGDAHLIQTPQGKTILIDAGYRDDAKRGLVPFLQKKGINRIDIGIVSHAHKDHYEGFLVLLENNIKIDTLYYNILNIEVCNNEIPWGCDYVDYAQFLYQVRRSGARMINPQKGDIIFSEGGIQLKVLANYNGKNSPVGQTDINDAALLLMLIYKDFKMYFAADLNRALGQYLADHETDDNLTATVLKVPHHGTEGVAPNAFFDRVAPKVAIVPAPTWLWCSLRSARIRNYFEAQDIPVFVRGFNGNITVETDGTNFQVIPQYNRPIHCSIIFLPSVLK